MNNESVELFCYLYYILLMQTLLLLSFSVLLKMQFLDF